MRLRLSVAALATMLLLALAGTASADYALVPWDNCGSGFNSGSYDDAGDLFVPCGNPSVLRVFGADGNLKAFTQLPFFVSDAAPSPDGEHVYVTSSDIVPHRLNRQADGSYVLDTVWAPAQYNLYGAKTPHGVFLDTDSNGNIYLADGAWSPNNTHTVIEYAPDGSVITRFGEYTYYGAADPHSWDLDFFYWMLTGIDAVGDGSVVYTLEGGNDRVQKFVRQGNGSYKASTSYGGSPATDPNREGACSNGVSFAGTFAAPYDLGNDAAGNFYVINTTCHEVIKFDSSWNYLTDINVGSENSPTDSWPDGSLKRPHGIAVAANGNVCIGQSHSRLQQTATPLPCNGTPPPTTTGGGGTGGGGGTTPPPPGGDPGGDPKPPTPPVADTTPPRITAAARARQRMGVARRISLSLSCDEACKAAASVKFRLGKRVVTVRSATTSMTAGNRARVSLRLSRLTARALPVRGLMVTVSVRATDAAGNVGRATRRIRISR